jgi:hypothetical protein
VEADSLIYSHIRFVSAKSRYQYFPVLVCLRGKGGQSLKSLLWCDLWTNVSKEIMLTIVETVVIVSIPMMVEVWLGLMMKMVVYVSVKVSV